jgi:tetratricopeptide (TPR) repeat protein
MRHLISAVTLLLLTVGAVQADTCPDAPDHSAELQGLIARINSAETEMDAREISNRMWELWADAPNEQAQALLDRGMSQRRVFNLLDARQAFDRLIEFCPKYAEGYNQRAFVNFLNHDFAAALPDLDRTLELSPDHVGALSGRALTLLGLGRIDAARADLEKALELNPWLSERSLAAPGGPLAPPGEDI